MNKKDVAKILLDLECVKVCAKEPFTYASGLKGPIYCDNRLILGHVEARNKIISHWTSLLNEHSGEFNCLSAMATAGIAHGAWLADKLMLPLTYIRSSAKSHGKQNQIEGKFPDNPKTIIIEDLINQGKSVGQGIDVVRPHSEISLISCIVDYQMPAAKELLSKYKISILSLTDFESIVDVAIDCNYLSETEKELLINWQKDPKSWSDQFNS